MAVRSMGFFVLPNSGMNLESFCLSSSLGVSTGTPYISPASVARTPIPPPLVMMSMFGPFMVGCRDSARDLSNRSSMVFALSIPLCFMAPSYTLSDPAREPVWEDAAIDPCMDLPDLSITIGFFETLAASRKLLPSFIPST